ncbi:MAG: phenylalanine 4-monooxygenase [Deltaproteobacteria bacterium]|nr:phenylalanine 4-monooxygenase [Deltaproteobacteria bacterium]
MSPDDIWKKLHLTQTASLRERAHPEFWHALSRLNLPEDRVPDLAKLDDTVQAAAGWRLVPVEGHVPEPEFFALLAARRFPVIRKLRPEGEVFYAREPDLWHDAFGHLPFLMNPMVARLYENFGHAGLRALRLAPRYLTHLSRFYWYTIEFGLIDDGAGPRIYGAGILPSPGETEHALSPRARRVRFDVSRVVERPYESGALQKVLYVVSSFEELEAEFTEWSQACLPGSYRAKPRPETSS